MDLKTLVLTSWMKPHQIITWQQAIAIVDILREGNCIQVGKADTLEVYEATVSSPSVTINIPAVIRLRKEVRAHKHGVKFSRSNLYTRDRNTCCYCGAKLPARKLNYDHVRPRVQGGITSWENIVTSCPRCNLKKGGRTPEQAGMEMRFKPYKPTTLPLGGPVVYDLEDMPEEWRPYLGQMTRSA